MTYLNNEPDIQKTLRMLGLAIEVSEGQIITIGNVVGNHETRIVTLEESITLNEEEIQAITDAIQNRVGYLLFQSGRMDLYGGFTAKCRRDCSRYSYYRGVSGRQTLRIRFYDLLSFIKSWEPMGYDGVDDYIDHLDELRNRNE